MVQPMDCAVPVVAAARPPFMSMSLYIQWRLVRKARLLLCPLSAARKKQEMSSQVAYSHQVSHCFMSWSGLLTLAGGDGTV